MKRKDWIKKAASVAASAAVAFALAPVPVASASSAGTTTGVANGLNYTMNADGTATVTGCVDKAATELVVPDKLAGHTVTCIDRMTLNMTGVEKLTLPSTLKCVGMARSNKNDTVTYTQNGFVGSQLKQIEFNGENDNFVVVDDVLYTADMKMMVYYLGVGKESEPDYTVPDGVEEFAGEAMYNAVWLKSIHLPSTFKPVSNNCFLTSMRLTSVTVDQTNPYLSSEDGILYDKTKTTLLVYPCGKQGTAFAAPSTVTTFGYQALERQMNLKKVEIGANVVDLGSSLTECPQLREITVDKGNSHFAVKDGVLYSKDLHTLLVYPAGKQAQRFEIPSHVTDIGNWAFSGCKISTVVVPPTTKKMHWSNFWSKDIGTIYVSTTYQREALLKNVNSSTNSASRVFLSEVRTGVVEASVAKLPKAGRAVSVAASTGKVRLTVLSVSAAKGAKAGKTGALARKRAKTYTGKVRVDYYPTGRDGRVNLRAVRLRGASGRFDVRLDVTEVAPKAFRGRRDVRLVTLANVARVGASSFSGCRNLKGASLGGGLTSIGASAFKGCKALKSVKISSARLKAGRVGSSAFKGTPRRMAAKVPKAKLVSYKGLLRKAGASSSARFTKI